MIEKVFLASMVIVGYLAILSILMGLFALIPSYILSLILPYSFAQCWSVVFAILFISGLLSKKN